MTTCKFSAEEDRILNKNKTNKLKKKKNRDTMHVFPKEMEPVQKIA